MRFRINNSSCQPIWNIKETSSKEIGKLKKRLAVSKYSPFLAEVLARNSQVKYWPTGLKKAYSLCNQTESEAHLIDQKLAEQLKKIKCKNVYIKV